MKEQATLPGSIITAWPIPASSITFVSPGWPTATLGRSIDRIEMNIESIESKKRKTPLLEELSRTSQDSFELDSESKESRDVRLNSFNSGIFRFVDSIDSIVSIRSILRPSVVVDRPVYVQKWYLQRKLQNLQQLSAPLTGTKARKWPAHCAHRRLRAARSATLCAARHAQPRAPCAVSGAARTNGHENGCENDSHRNAKAFRLFAISLCRIWQMSICLKLGRYFSMYQSRA